MEGSDRLLASEQRKEPSRSPSSLLIYGATCCTIPTNSCRKRTVYFACTWSLWRLGSGSNRSKRCCASR